MNASFSSPDKICALQDCLLREHVTYAFEHSPFYRERLRESGFAPDSFRGVADLALLPLTEKRDLDSRNDAFLAAPADEIVDVCLTSATTGERPTALLQTKADLERLALNEYLAFTTAGLTPRDTLYICAALDKCFMAGLAYFMGAVRLGARAVRGGSGSAAQHWQLLKTTGATAIVGVPSLMRKIAEAALENGEDPRALGVKRLLAIGEPTRGRELELLPASDALERMWGAELFRPMPRPSWRRPSANAR